MQGRNYSPEAIAQLEQERRVIVRRNPESGEIEAAQFLPQTDFKPTVRNSIPTGTYYSCEELVEAAGHKAWKLKDLVKDATKLVGQEKRDVDTFLLGIFRATQLSCMTPDAEPTKAARSAEALSLGPQKFEVVSRGRRQEKKRQRKEQRRQTRLARKRAKTS